LELCIGYWCCFGIMYVIFLLTFFARSNVSRGDDLQRQCPAEFRIDLVECLVPPLVGGKNVHDVFGFGTNPSIDHRQGGLGGVFLRPRVNPEWLVQHYDFRRLLEISRIIYRSRPVVPIPFIVADAVIECFDRATTMTVIQKLEYMCEERLSMRLFVFEYMQAQRETKKKELTISSPGASSRMA
jgi:hypothetical protein